MIKHPKVAEQCFQMATEIDIHNHVSTGFPDQKMHELPKITFACNLQKLLALQLAIHSLLQHISPRILKRNLSMKHNM